VTSNVDAGQREARRMLGAVPVRDELERLIRARGVRVEERLTLLRLLFEEDAGERLAERQQELLAEVRAAADAVRREALS
jgi:hypothetical protein